MPSHSRHAPQVRVPATDTVRLRVRIKGYRGVSEERNTDSGHTDTEARQQMGGSARGKRIKRKARKEQETATQCITQEDEEQQLELTQPQRMTAGSLARRRAEGLFRDP